MRSNFWGHDGSFLTAMSEGYKQMLYVLKLTQFFPFEGLFLWFIFCIEGANRCRSKCDTTILSVPFFICINTSFLYTSILNWEEISVFKCKESALGYTLT